MVLGLTLRRQIRVSTIGIIGGLLGLLVVASTACEDTPQSTDVFDATTPPATATAATETPEAVHPVLEGAVAALEDTRSFGFIESSESESLGSETTFETTGNYQSPNRFTRHALFREFPTQEAVAVRSINVGDETYLTDPATGEWMLFHNNLGLPHIYEELLFVNPVERFAGVLSEGGPYTHQGVTTLQGVRVHHFVSTTDRYAYTRAAGPLHIEVWIGAEDLLVRRITRSHSWTEVPCDPDLVCPDILVNPGSQSYDLQFSFPGDETPIVTPPIGVP